ncbi:hypothetical protein [Chryseobacterium lathyri]|uniref:Uncharacterized protein n=1 Tax=Chryseobacterium lathyri TaxID=395933 RepID=A0ABT9SN69_9FLAO|nr:hypothetical protein [Chryseobacterium lathyri]MDP9960847.1 hypothetical protein [Chryseobacterium lathyri]
MKKQIFCLLIGFITTTIDGQIGIGTATPDPSSILELSSPDKALLLPRISLTSTADITTVANPVKGLLVYNLSDSGTGTGRVYKDLIYLYDGILWQALMDYKLAANTINLPVLYSRGRKTTSTTCTGSGGGNFILDIRDDNMGISGAITADKAGYYKFTARIVQYFQLEFGPGLTTPSSLFSYDFRGAAGYQDRKITTSGVIYLQKGQTSINFGWGLGGNYLCNSTHRIKEQEVIWTYLGDL